MLITTPSPASIKTSNYLIIHLNLKTPLALLDEISIINLIIHTLFPLKYFLFKSYITLIFTVIY